MFYKSFPVRNEMGVKWEEIYLMPKDEKLAEEQANMQNLEVMQNCLDDAKQILSKNNYKLMQNSIVNVAMQLFSKRADHNVFYKERKCREILERINKKNN